MSKSFKNQKELKDNKMPRSRKHRDKLDNRKQVVKAITTKLFVIIGIFTVILLALILKIAEVWWSSWLLTHRTQMIGLVSLILLSMIFSAPIIIEAGSNTRTLSGPGKTPQDLGASNIDELK